METGASHRTPRGAMACFKPVKFLTCSCLQVDMSKDSSLFSDSLHLLVSAVVGAIVAGALLSPQVCFHMDS